MHFKLRVKIIENNFLNIFNKKYYYFSTIESILRFTFLLKVDNQIFTVNFEENNCFLVMY